MRPILALNSLLQIEQERSEKESSVGDALALAFRCARFCSASLILFASYSPAPLLMKPRHFVRSCAICSHDSVGMLKSLEQFRKLISRYKRIDYSLDIMRQTARLVINQIIVDGYASLFNCTTAVRASDSMTAYS